ncbi:hypothetical protein B0H12DRAFT_1109591 [Mycena haematopus]|nr:hypothetical protein B0H12DRAFT_1109591 [Mycena haematopus]
MHRTRDKFAKLSSRGYQITPVSSPISRALPDKAAQIGSRTGESENTKISLPLKMMACALTTHRRKEKLARRYTRWSNRTSVSPGDSRAELTSVMIQARRHATASPRCNPHSPYTAPRSF